VFKDNRAPFRLPALSLIGKDVLIEFSHFRGDPGKERGATEVYLGVSLLKSGVLSSSFYFIKGSRKITSTLF